MSAPNKNDFLWQRSKFVLIMHVYSIISIQVSLIFFQKSKPSQAVSF